MSNESIDTSPVLARTSATTGTKVIVTTVALLAVAALGSLLPGVDRFVPLPDGILGSLFMATISIALAASLIAIAPTLAGRATIAIGRPAAFAADVGSIVHWGTVLAAVIVVHRGFAALASTFLDGLVIVYDVVFLALALPPFLIVVLRLYLCLDPLTYRLARTLDDVRRGRDPGAP